MRDQGDNEGAREEDERVKEEAGDDGRKREIK